MKLDYGRLSRSRERLANGDQWECLACSGPVEEIDAGDTADDLDCECECDCPACAACELKSDDEQGVYHCLFCDKTDRVARRAGSVARALEPLALQAWKEAVA